MASDPTDATLDLARYHAMLFSPPLPPVRLQAGAVIVIGRHHSCDLCVRCDDVSRRHAEVRSEGSHFEIQDLSSTNGTFVNGEKIEGAHALRPGDRIEIGSLLVTFCSIETALEADPGESDPGKTVLQLEPPKPEAFRGALSEIPPFALLQVLEMGSKTGLLEFEGGEVAGRIWFSHGLPIHSETEKQVGFDAAIQMVGATQGRFRFEPQEITIDRTIQASVTELLLEACRQADEA